MSVGILYRTVALSNRFFDRHRAILHWIYRCGDRSAEVLAALADLFPAYRFYPPLYRSGLFHTNLYTYSYIYSHINTLKDNTAGFGLID